MQYTAHFVVFLIFPLQQRDSEQQGDVLSSLWPRDRATLLAKDTGIDPNRPSTLSSSGNDQISEKGCLPLMVKEVLGFEIFGWALDPNFSFTFPLFCPNSPVIYTFWLFTFLLEFPSGRCVRASRGEGLRLCSFLSLRCSERVYWLAPNLAQGVVACLSAVFPFPAINLSKIEQEKMYAKDFEDRLVDGNIQIMLISTSRTIEAKYIDHCTELINWKVVPVGPPVQDPITNDVDNKELMDWLETKDVNSTVFVSFGSEYFLSKEDMEEVAFGLELSNVNFIWVARFPKGEDQNLEDALPKGFLERIGERGRVLDKFAPQPRILNHPSTGGFISHCGWNSVMESVDFGVPIIAMPIQYDQPSNARLIVELGVAVEIVRDDDGKIHRGEIAETLKDVITGKTGENLRGKVRDISKNLKSIRGEEMDTAAEVLIQLCKNSNECK
ncbi:beta-D-glucosyl crocetin beta-1,6-glucosyltransferase-like [Solanum tuberosum]|nr:PREDICTED: beta-D-glucosyl crocetin beta-1,6-glucosyltransferase-like [Solanum tuberosum]